MTAMIRNQYLGGDKGGVIDEGVSYNDMSCCIFDSMFRE
jgi:hypothetical protein